MAEVSLRESLMAAAQQTSQQSAPLAEEHAPTDAAPESPREYAPEGPEESPQEPTEAAPPRPRDEAGRFARAQAAAKALAGKTPAPGAAQAQGPTPKPAAPTPQGEKPPASWKPAIREQWAALPPEVKAEVVRREREVSVALQQTATHRKTAEDFERTLQPYRAFIQGEPTQVVGNLLQTAVALQTGTPQQRAAIAAQIIKGYGIDIETLAAALDGKAPTPAPSTPQEIRDPRFDQFIGHVQQMKQQKSAAAVAEAQQELETFAQTHEFLDDVAPLMANLMRAARESGQTLSTEEAYEQACHLHKDVRPLYQQRKAAEQAAKAQASTQQARRAASSIRHEPTAPTSGAQPTSLRDTIQAAWSASTRR